MLVNRLPLVQKATVLTLLGLLAGIIWSWPLWYAAARPSVPLLPVLGAAHTEAAGWSFLSAGLLLSMLAAALLFPAKKIALGALLMGLATLCCLDLNRLQPWVWCYGLVLGIALFNQSTTDTRNALRWLLAAVYFWSGFHKLTPYFAEDNFAWFCSAFSWTKSLARFSGLGYAVALLEMSLAFGLLWPRTRAVFRWLALGFHGIITLLLSPWGLHWNIVVIPWNITLAGLVWLTYAQPDVTTLPRNNALRLLLTLAGVAPVLHCFGAWPEAWSWKLYSNTQPEATFYAPAGSFNNTIMQDIWAKNAFDHGQKLLLDDWANAELQVPMFSATRTFRQTASYLCGCAAQPDSAGLYILTVQPWNRSGEKWQKIPCQNLLNKHE